MIIENYCLCGQKFRPYHNSKKHSNKEYVEVCYSTLSSSCPYNSAKHYSQKENIYFVEFQMGGYILWFDLYERKLFIHNLSDTQVIFEMKLSDLNDLSIDELKSKLNLIITYL